MPWLAFRESDDRYLRAKSLGVYTSDAKSAIKFKTREDAEYYVSSNKIKDKLFFIEMTPQEVYGRNYIPPKSHNNATRRVYGKVSAEECRRKRTEEAEQWLSDGELEARKIAVRILCWPWMPDGKPNPRRLQRRDSTNCDKIDELAAAILDGSYAIGELPVTFSSNAYHVNEKKIHGREIAMRELVYSNQRKGSSECQVTE